MKKEKKIICKNCFNRWRFERKDWCGIIENEYGGNIPADKAECEFYLKKGTEPKWPCCKCGKNTYGENSTGYGGKWWCSDCWFKKEMKETEQRKAIKQKQNIEMISKILGGDKKKAKEIVDLLK